MNSDIEEIKSRLNIIDVLGGYIRLEKAGANHRALCPFHNEKSPSFMVNEEKQFWHCFGCQKSGDIFNFVMEIEGLEFKEALNILADKAGVPLQKYNSQGAGVKDKTFEIMELAVKFYEKQLWDGAGKEKIMNYLRERGLRDETIKEFRLGYAPNGWRNMLQFLLSRGYSAAEINKTGLLVEKKDAQISNNQFLTSKQVSSLDSQNTKYQIQDTRCYDRFRDRIMFPIFDVMGKAVGFSARVAPGGDESQAKYVNTPETEIYHKSRILYGMNSAKQEAKNKKFVLLVEGNMDVIAAHQAGIKNTVAVSGTALTEEQITIIKRYADKIKMMFDMDSAGENATKKSARLCFEKGMGLEIIELPEGKDAADLARKDPAGLVAAVEKSFGALDYFLKKSFARNDKNTAEGKKKIGAEILEIIGAIEDGVEKSHWLKKLAEALDVAESVLTDMLKKATLNSRASQNFSEKAEAFIPRNKKEMLVRELCGLAMIYADAWKVLVEKNRNGELKGRNSLMDSLLEKGGAAEYNFDIFLKLLGSREAAAEAEKIFFEKKYRLGLDNSLEEVIVGNPAGELHGLLREIEKEEKKEKLEKIEEDLKIAERKGDRTAADFLKNQFKKILEELSSIINN